MAAGAAVALCGVGGKEYPGKLTLFVFITCIVAATGGLIFGYDIGISGGVTSMDSFLRKFFPSVYRKEAEEQSSGGNQYCKFDSQLLTAFTSSLYLAALVASFFASSVTRTFGRKWSMFGGGVTVLVGSALNGAAMNVLMLILGRVLLGVGVGFTTQSVPVYLSEMAPARLRGMLNNGFQLMITVGILCANLVNYGAAKIEGDWGWRLSLALAAVPAAIITLGSLFLPDTPNSLFERGHDADAKRVLCRIRGTDDVLDEFNDLATASAESKLVERPWANILRRRYRPQLAMALLIPFFQQLTGINMIMFYAPVLFKTIGFGGDASLVSAVITGLVNVLATFVSIFTVDRVGRRTLFLQGGIQMLLCQAVVGTLFAVKFSAAGEGSFSKTYAWFIVLFVCLFVAAFAWSWGPLGCLVPSEIFPLEIRSAGFSIVVSVSMLFTFVIAQAFLAMLCRMKFALFFFFGVWVAVMTIFVALFLPETKSVPIEDMARVWKAHWFWAKFSPHHDINVGGGGHGIDMANGKPIHV